jgi:aminoglycoside phosphotransferase (APT) family kinase protein
MDIPLHLHKVLAYARTKLGAEIELWELTTSRLDPGYVSEPPRRWDLIFRLPEGNLETISIVQKFTHAGEARVMAALGEIKLAEAIPEVIDYGVEKHAPEGKPKHWFITPFYEGCPLTFEDEMPVEVIRTLAQVHTRFAGQIEAFTSVEGIYRVDGAFFQQTFTNALESLEKLLSRQPDDNLQMAVDEMRSVSISPVFTAELSQLPITLTHGDVHAGNMISTGQKTFLLDWGNARLAPAMLDVANMIDIDSPNWLVYLETWQEACGSPMNPSQAQRGYHWATAMVNLQYLPFATEHMPQLAPQMIAKVIEAHQQLAKV